MSAYEQMNLPVCMASKENATTICAQSRDLRTITTILVSSMTSSLRARLTTPSAWRRRHTRERKKLGAYAMKRVAAGAHLPTPWLLSLRNAQTIDPTTARTAVSSPAVPSPNEGVLTISERCSICAVQMILLQDV